MKRNAFLLIPALLFSSCSGKIKLADDTVPERYNRVLNGSNYTMTIDLWRVDGDRRVRTLLFEREGYKILMSDIVYSETGETVSRFDEIYVGYKKDKSLDYYSRGDDNQWEYKNGVDEGMFDALFLNIVDESHWSYILLYSWIAEEYENAVNSEDTYYYPDVEVTYGAGAKMHFRNNEVTIDETALTAKSFMTDTTYYLTTFNRIGETSVSVPKKPSPKQEYLFEVGLDGEELYKSNDGIVMQESTAEMIEQYLDNHNSETGRNDIESYAFCYSFDFDASNKNLSFEAQFAGKNAERLIKVMRILLRVEDKETGEKKNIYFGADSSKMNASGKDYRSPIAQFEQTLEGNLLSTFSSDGNDGYCKSFEYENTTASDSIYLYGMNNVHVSVILYLEGYDEDSHSPAPIEASLKKMHFSFTSEEKRVYEWE